MNSRRYGDVAVNQANPFRRIVKGIVERLKEKHTPPATDFYTL